MLRKVLIATLGSLLLQVATCLACTSAIIGASANPSGRPILWKHRDTSNTDNKVEYVPGVNGDLSYVALFNANDKKLKEAWMGMNDAGFAVMNTASYNIKNDKVPASKMDQEGILMTAALKKCRTVDDFEQFLNQYPRPMGVEANFGVIDALGNGAYFETNNYGFKRFDLKDSPNNVLIRTNYSHSGREREGYGFIREANAEHLLAPYIKERSVTPEVLTEEVSRSFYHDMLKCDFVKSGFDWAIDQDFIPRFKSTATVAIEGCVPVTDLKEIDPDFVRQQYIMWTGLGYPPCAETRAVYCAPDGVENDLRGSLPNGHAPLADKAQQMRNDVFPYRTTGNGEKYVEIRKLYNESGNGYAQTMKRKSLENYKKIRSSRNKTIGENTK